MKKKNNDLELKIYNLNDKSIIELKNKSRERKTIYISQLGYFRRYKIFT